jgi:hypothetical protein
MLDVKQGREQTLTFSIKTNDYVSKHDFEQLLQKGGQASNEEVEQAFISRDHLEKFVQLFTSNFIVPLVSGSGVDAEEVREMNANIKEATVRDRA